MILAEFENEPGVINPSDLVKKKSDFPKVGISCFENQLVEHILDSYQPKAITELSSSDEPEIYEIDFEGTKIAFFKSPVGASVCVANYDIALELGLETLVLFGTCGVLDKSIEENSIIIPTSAIRDEGTSYHYMEASDEVECNPKYRDLFETILEERDISYTEGKVWTTDAIFRETKSKVARRKEAGCVCVDMECSAMFAAAKFRKKDLFQFFYAADNLDAEEWDKRNLGCKDDLDEKAKVAILALELAKKIADQ